MAKRKRIVKDRAELANLVAKLEGGKSQGKVGDYRQALKLIKKLETVSILSGCASIVLIIRREARVEAAIVKAKRKAKRVRK